MPPSGRKKQASEPLLESLEIHLKQLLSSATTALRLLKLTKRNFTALRQEEIDTSAASELTNLTDSQVVSKNLLEAVRLVGAKAVATAATAERAIISQKGSEHNIGPQDISRGTATQQGPSAKTQRRKLLREASRVARQSASTDSDKERTEIMQRTSLSPKPTKARRASRPGNEKRSESLPAASKPPLDKSQKRQASQRLGNDKSLHTAKS